ncbi:arylsulfatase [Catonella morbi ATCC 51271]|uniref:Arylsulfatase n=1 Tax=Catonella morbi ATCC 51271 TaxID=592026 RepID=V2Y4C9_9FIRM|nr:sulfatase [Catonella morbi]ESL02551.1 arylsulfatase [Catonella morbi ATCC 51271]
MNLLFVFADQWRAGAMGYANEDPVLTPLMDRFCSESTYCDHAFSTFPVCSPHRASLMTGKYPLSAGFFTNCKRGLPLRLGDDEICVGQVLKEAGYDTAYIGKWHLDEPEQNHCEEPKSGARDWDAYTPPGVRRHGFDYWYSYGTCDTHLSPHYWQDTDEMIKVKQWSPEHETDKAIEYLSEKRDKSKPFALYMSWNPPHSVYSEVPEEYLNLYDKVELKSNVNLKDIHHHTGENAARTEEEMILTTKQYYAAVSGLDRQFGRLIDYLKENNLYDDTLIILSADHGDMMGSHGLMGKHVWYEESIRIPFVVHMPGNDNKKCCTCIGSQDMMPTVLGLLNCPIPDTVEGEDCSRFIKGEEDEDRVSFICASPGRADFVEKFKKAGKNPAAYGWRGVRTKRYTFVLELGYDVICKPKRYLYDILKDPEQKNLLDLEDEENKEIAKKLEAEVIGWMKRQNDSFLDNWLKEADNE